MAPKSKTLPTAKRSAWQISLCSVAMLLAGCGSSPGSVDADVAARVDAITDSYTAPGTPGVALGVIQGGELVAESYRGLANLEHRVPVTSRTRFHVASVSKQFTGYGVQLLVERGALTLDDRVGDHLEGMPEIVADITIRQLLHHTSGLRNNTALLNLQGRRSGRVMTQDESLELIRAHRELNFEPGSAYVYSNSNYILLATIVEAVTGERFADWMQANVFAPIGLDRTLVVDSYDEIVPDRARSYSRDGDAFVHDAGLFWAMYGTAGVHTTLEDLARWITFLMDPPAESEAVVTAMYRTGTLTGGEPINYASGLRVGEFRGMRQVWHGGTANGARTFMTFLPDEKAGMIMITNAPLQTDGMPMESMEATVGLALTGLESGTAIAGPTVEEDGNVPPSPLPDDVRGRLVGRFLVVEEGAEYAPEIVNFERKADGIMVVWASGESQPLEGVGPGRLGVEGAEIEFDLPDGDGPLTRMTLRRPEGTRPLRRIDPEANGLSPRQALEYAGRYRSPELEADLEVGLEGDALVIRQPPRRWLRLDRVDGDTFGTDANLLGWIRFERGEDGVVHGFRLTTHDLRVGRLWYERIRSE